MKTKNEPTKPSVSASPQKTATEVSVDSTHQNHPQKLKAEMNALVDHLRMDVSKVTDPRAQALFETSAEVLIGLVKAFSDYESKTEAAWSKAPARRNEMAAGKPMAASPEKRGR